MLRLWRDRVRIAVCRDRVVLIRYKPGFRPSLVAKEVHRCSRPESGWQEILATLKAILGSPCCRDADATVILSNSFVHFQMLPWSEVTLTDEEKASLLRHRFFEVYGQDGVTLELRLHEGSFRSSSLGSAVDQGLLEDVRNAFNGTGVRLKSIQPYLMTAFNACRHRLGSEAAWLVLAEQDVFCIGMLNRGQWQSIRLRIANGDWFREVMRTLEREMLLIEHGSDHRKLFVYSPEHPSSQLGTPAEIVVHQLMPESRVALSSEDMGIYAMAAAGI